jgi:hypothetical protein
MAKKGNGIKADNIEQLFRDDPYLIPFKDEIRRR